MYAIVECLNCGAIEPYCKCGKTDYMQRIETEPEDYGIDDSDPDDPEPKHNILYNDPIDGYVYD